MTNLIKANPLNYKFIRYVLQASDILDIPIQAMWTNEYAGIPSNKVADKKVKKGTYTSIPLYQHVWTIYNNLKSSNHKFMIKQWETDHNEYISSKMITTRALSKHL